MNSLEFSLRNVFMMSPEQKMFSASADSSYKHTYIGNYSTFYNSVFFSVWLISL
jgi:hypothetical protein